MRLGLCLGCGNKGHLIANCPEKTGSQPGSSPKNLPTPAGSKGEKGCPGKADRDDQTFQVVAWGEKESTILKFLKFWTSNSQGPSSVPAQMETFSQEQDEWVFHSHVKAAELISKFHQQYPDKPGP